MSQKNKKHPIGILAFYHKIYTYIKSYPVLFNSLILVIILQTAVYYVVPFLTESIFDVAIPTKNHHLLLLLSIGFLGVLLVLFATFVSYDYLVANLGNKVTDDLRKSIHNKILMLTADEMRNFSKSDLIGKFSDHIGIVRFAVMQVYWNGVIGLSSVVFSSFLLFYLNLTMSVFMTLFLVLAFTTTVFVSRLTTNYLPTKQRGDEKLLNILSETLMLHAPIRLLGLVDFRSAQFNKVINHMQSSEIYYNFFNAMARSSMALGAVTIRLFMLAIGGYLIFENKLTIGVFVGYIALLNNLVSGMNSMASCLPLLTQAKSSFEKIEEILNFKPSMTLDKNLPKIANLSNTLMLKDVSFAYSTSDKAILKNINLEVGLQQSIAIVGISGAGKSTLLGILLRELTPTLGEIIFDNHNLLKYSVKSFLDQIGVVLQTPYAFEASILDNIKMRKPNATYAEVVDAAQQAGIHDEILKMEQGYNTVIGKEKFQLSVGQLQRVVIAQALLGNPTILILDEPTASLDLISQEMVQKTLLKQTGRRAIIMVTHHLNEVTNVDKIYVMHEGQIVESGKHEELINLNDYYARLWNKQHITLEKHSGQLAINPDWLRNIVFFREFDKKILNELAKEFLVEQFAVNQIILDEGEPGDKFYIIAKGQVEVSKFLQDSNQRQILAILENGDFFGELALLQPIARTARVTTLETCTLLVLNRNQFNRLLDKLSPTARAEFDIKISQRLDATL